MKEIYKEPIFDIHPSRKEGYEVRLHGKTYNEIIEYKGDKKWWKENVYYWFENEIT